MVYDVTYIHAILLQQEHGLWRDLPAIVPLVLARLGQTDVTSGKRMAIPSSTKKNVIVPADQDSLKSRPVKRTVWTNHQ